PGGPRNRSRIEDCNSMDPECCPASRFQLSWTSTPNGSSLSSALHTLALRAIPARLQCGSNGRLRRGLQWRSSCLSDRSDSGKVNLRQNSASRLPWVPRFGLYEAKVL